MRYIVFRILMIFEMDFVLFYKCHIYMHRNWNPFILQVICDWNIMYICFSNVLGVINLHLDTTTCDHMRLSMNRGASSSPMRLYGPLCVRSYHLTWW